MATFGLRMLLINALQEDVAQTGRLDRDSRSHLSRLRYGAFGARTGKQHFRAQPDEVGRARIAHGFVRHGHCAEELGQPECHREDVEKAAGSDP